MRLTFRKEEKLNSATEIEKLFREGRSVVFHPIKILFLISSVEARHKTKVLITVPSKKFRNAVDRNRIKRKIREVYRLNRHHLNKGSTNDMAYTLGIIYTGFERFPDYSIIESAFIKCAEKIAGNLKQVK